MKSMILAMSLLAFVTSDVYSQKMKGFTRSEKSFVRNVIEAHKSEKMLSVIKRPDNHIVVEFETTIVVLKPDGYVGEIWILGDGDWLSLGTEEDAY